MAYSSHINSLSKLLLVTALWLSLGALSLAKIVYAKEVLTPEQFSGSIAEGYKAAQKSKYICSKLFCYCGCDLTDEHTSLLDCFTSMHGVDCAICQEEAILACHMQAQKKSLAQIQKAVDERFAAQYPWDDISPVLAKYLKTSASGKIFGLTSKSRTSTRYNTKSKKLANKKSGQCCGH